VDVLGALKWYVPRFIQAAFANVARLMGKTMVMERCTPAEEWAKFEQGFIKKKKLPVYCCFSFLVTIHNLHSVPSIENSLQ
jgi:hypothetical protein